MLDEVKITMEEARDLVSDQTLWPLVRDFLWNFAPQVHKSWLDGLEVGKSVGLTEAQIADLSSTQAFKRFMLAQLGILPCFHAFPKGDWSRLLLIDGLTLESIAKWLGALACADELRRVTAGATVRELKSTLAGVYPEVFGFTMYFKGMGVVAKSVRDHDAPVSGSGIVAVGTRLLSSLFENVPEPIVSRLKFKFPKSLGGLFGETAPRMDASFVIKLLKLKFPEAYKLCC